MTRQNAISEGRENFQTRVSAPGISQRVLMTAVLRGGQRSGLHQHAQNASYNFDQVGRGHRNAGPSRGRGVCYAFQTGNCNRGGACRFLHPNT